MDTGAPSAGLKQPGCTNDYAPPCNSNGNNELDCNYTPLHDFMAYVGTTIYTIVVNFTISYKTINSKNLTKHPHSHEGYYSCLTQYLNLHITREDSRYSYNRRTNLNIR